MTQSFECMGTYRHRYCIAPTAQDSDSSGDDGADEMVTMSTRMFWALNRGRRYYERKNARAAQHQASMAKAAAASASSSSSSAAAPPRPPPQRPVSGPARALQACWLCMGARHFALKCPRSLCGVCCPAQAAGPCEWHAANRGY